MDLRGLRHPAQAIMSVGKPNLSYLMAGHPIVRHKFQFCQLSSLQLCADMPLVLLFLVYIGADLRAHIAAIISRGLRSQAAAQAILSVSKPIVSYPMAGHPIVRHKFRFWEQHTVAGMVMMDVHHSCNHACEALARRLVFAGSFSGSGI